MKLMSSKKTSPMNNFFMINKVKYEHLLALFK